jgi:uncharacterized membrane protein
MSDASSPDGQPGANDPLDRNARRDVFASLADEGAFPADKLDRAASVIADSSWTSRWLSRALLIYGLTLVAVGVVFFFGFNWDEIPDLAKLGLIQVGFAGALAAGSLRDLHSVTSRVLLVVAGVLVGVFLAVFGQVYQTSADAWEFFATWAAILLPLALLAGTQGAWVLCAGVATIAGVTGLEQAYVSGRMLRYFLQTTWIFGMSALVLALTEWLRHRGAGLVEDYPWSRPLLQVAGFGALTLHICLFEAFNRGGGFTAVSVLLLAAASVAAVRYYVERVGDIVAPSVVGLSWLVICLRFLAEWTFDGFDDGLLGFLVMAVLTLALTAALVGVLRRIHSALGDRHKEAS